MYQSVSRGYSWLFGKNLPLLITGGIVFSVALSTLYSLNILSGEIMFIIAIIPFILWLFLAHYEVIFIFLIAAYFGGGYFFSDFVMQGFLRGFFLFLIGLALLSKSGIQKRISRVQTPLNKLLVIWSVIIFVAFINGLLFKHNNPEHLFGDLYKFVEIIFIFWMTTFLIRTDRQVKLFVWGFFVLVIVFAGIDFTVFFQKAQIIGSALESRVRAGAQFSSIFALIIAVCLMLYEKRRRIRTILGFLVLGFFTGFLVCFLRTGYVVLPLTLIFVLSLYLYKEKRYSPKGVKKLFFALIFLLFFIGFLSLVITKLNPNIDIIRATFDRFNSLINPGSVDPMGYRMVEIKCIISQVLAKNPLFGKGLGGEYYSLGRIIPGETVWQWFAKHYVHNNYFEFIMRTGIIGLIVFILICFKYLKDAIGFYLMSKNKFYKGFLLGCIGVFVSSCLIAFSANSFYSPFLFSIMAMTYCVACLEKKENRLS